jgi:hypothetical protein
MLKKHKNIKPILEAKSVYKDNFIAPTHNPGDSQRWYYPMEGDMNKSAVGYGSSCSGYGGMMTSTAAILVLFILLVIVSRTILGY